MRKSPRQLRIAPAGRPVKNIKMGSGIGWSLLAQVSVEMTQRHGERRIGLPATGASSTPLRSRIKLLSGASGSIPILGRCVPNNCRHKRHYDSCLCWLVPFLQCFYPYKIRQIGFPGHSTNLCCSHGFEAKIVICKKSTVGGFCERIPPLLPL